MTDLLQTKIYMPKHQENMVPRPGLLSRLSNGLTGKLALLSAPAGFGKSTILMEWIHKAKIPFGWLTLDQHDNDLGRFLTYIIASLGTISIKVDPQIPSLLHVQNSIPLEDLLIPIINQVLVAKQHFGLVLDDYHLIKHEGIHNALAYLLDYLPQNMHVVIATRSDPPLNLAKLRAEGQMTEIRASQLRFSIEEAECLLNKLQGLNLSDEDIKLLVTRTDGWIVGLQMAALALMGKEDPTYYLREFSGNQEYIADYLTSEVFTQQTESIKQFLLKTSILDRFCAPLCDAVTGSGDGKATLKYLKEKNLFVMGLDDKNQWFRYHRLFADLIQQRLLEILPDMLPVCCLKASEWFDANGYIPEAIDYAFRGKYYHRAVDLILNETEPILTRSEINTFIRWVDELPEAVLSDHQTLCIYYAWALIVGENDHRKASHYLMKVVPMDDPTRGRVNTVKAMLAVYDRDTDEAVRLAKLALVQLNPQDHFFRHVAAWNLSASLFISGDVEGGIQMLEEVARVSLAGQNLLVAIIALCRLGSYRYQQGRLGQAKNLFEKAIGIRPEGEAQPLPASCEALLGLGKVYWERAEFVTARKYLQDGLQLSKQWRAVTDVNNYIVLAHINQALGSNDDASKYINLAIRQARRNAATVMGERFVAAQTALLAMLQENHSVVEQWVAEGKFEEIIQEKNFDKMGSSGTDIVLGYELNIYARYLIADNQVDKALDLLDNLHPYLQRLGHQSQVFTLRISRALGYQALGRTSQAEAAMITVLEDAEKEGFKRVFLEQGQIAADLIESCVARGFESIFAVEILDLFRDVLSGKKSSLAVKDLIEPLSEREIEVLKLLESQLTAPEIAERLYIAVSTLRTHVRNIYSKLGVHSRFEAVAKGRDLKLI
jgi:LuxR family maltose regulon positive regulatory protein